MAILDVDGQPVNRAFSAARLNDRKIDELIGLCRGVLADGALSIEEAQFIQVWINRNKEISNHWPANVLYARLEKALSDGHLDFEEERELISTLMELTGEPSATVQAQSNSSGLPLCDPPPDVMFYGEAFCFTGKFASGSRKHVESIAHGLGAKTKSSPSGKVSYLVIGAVGSSDWIHSTHGRKIEKAVALKEKGTGINIISEEHWYLSIPLDVSL